MDVETNLASLNGARMEASARALLSLREATMLADVPEKVVRKDIENGVLNAPHIYRIKDSRLRVHWPFVFTLAAIYGNAHLNSALRKRALDEVAHSRRLADEGLFANHGSVKCPYTKRSDIDRLVNVFSSCHVFLDKYVFLDFSAVVREVNPRVDPYIKGLMRVEEKDNILGGDAVFKDTRLSVTHIGKAFDRGESISNLLEDYNYLSESDIHFARSYYRAHPATGRPPSTSENTSVPVPPAA